MTWPMVHNEMRSANQKGQFVSSICREKNWQDQNKGRKLIHPDEKNYFQFRLKISKITLCDYFSVKKTWMRTLSSICGIIQVFGRGKKGHCGSSLVQVLLLLHVRLLLSTCIRIKSSKTRVNVRTTGKMNCNILKRIKE